LCVLGISTEAARHRIKRAAELGLVDYEPNPRLAAAGKKGHAARYLGSAA
jgi:hypothetical protein